MARAKEQLIALASSTELFQRLAFRWRRASTTSAALPRMLIIASMATRKAWIVLVADDGVRAVMTASWLVQMG